MYPGYKRVYVWIPLSASSTSTVVPETGSIWALLKDVDGALCQEMQGAAAGGKAAWRVFVPRTFVKPYRGNKVQLRLNTEVGQDFQELTHLAIRLYPDGGVNRVKVF